MFGGQRDAVQDLSFVRILRKKADLADKESNLKIDVSNDPPNPGCAVAYYGKPLNGEGHPLRKDYDAGRIPVQFKGANT